MCRELLSNYHHTRLCWSEVSETTLPSLLWHSPVHPCTIIKPVAGSSLCATIHVQYMYILLYDTQTMQDVENENLFPRQTWQFRVLSTPDHARAMTNLQSNCSVLHEHGGTNYVALMWCDSWHRTSKIQICRKQMYWCGT